MTREEALKEIRSWDFINEDDMEVLEVLIPELAESEDERIRKWLIHEIEAIYVTDGIVKNENADKALAWLEKHKETLHIQETCKENPDSFTDEGERVRAVILKLVLGMRDEIFTTADKSVTKPKVLAWLEKQKEQPTNEEMLRTLRVEYEKGVADTIAKYEQKEHSMSAEEVLARAGLKPYKDGNQWCILAGDNIQDGICGFGDTIDDALYEFLKEVLIMANSPQLKEQKPLSTEETELNSLAFLSQMGYTCIPPKKEHQNNSDAPKNALGGALNSPLDKDKNLDDIAQDYVDGVKEYNPEPTWNLMQTAVCYGYHYREEEEQKPAGWSEEDDWKRKELIQYLEEKGDYRTVWMTWLKSLRGKFVQED